MRDDPASSSKRLLKAFTAQFMDMAANSALLANLSNRPAHLEEEDDEEEE